MSLFVDIEKSFGAFSLNVQFEANNEVMGLLGASGCGKSMTLKCVAGIVKPDSGVIVAGGRTLFDSKKGVNLPPQQRDVGMLFQNYALFPNMTVEENIRCVLAHTKKRGDMETRLQLLLSRFYLKGLKKHYPAQLSGGQQQRCALARIMASEPSVMMLDEPLSALDSYLRWQVELELIQTLEEFSGSTIFVSHNRDEIYRICSKVCPMSGGRANAVYGMKDLFAHPDSLAACMLSGCKNYSLAQKRSERTVYAADWGIELVCAAPVPNGVNRIGVRSHYVRLALPSDSVNIIPCRVERVIEDVFAVIVNAKPNGAPRCIRMELSDVHAPRLLRGDIVDLAISPKDVILLDK